MPDTEMTTLEKTALTAQEIGFRHGASSGKLTHASAGLQCAMNLTAAGDRPAARRELDKLVMPFLLSEAHWKDLMREIRRYGFRPTAEALECPGKAGELGRKYYAIRGKIAEPVILTSQEIAGDISELIAEAQEFQTTMFRIKAGLLNEVIRQAGTTGEAAVRNKR